MTEHIEFDPVTGAPIDTGMDAARAAVDGLLERCRYNWKRAATEAVIDAFAQVYGADAPASRMVTRGPSPWRSVRTWKATRLRPEPWPGWTKKDWPLSTTPPYLRR